MAKGFSGDGTVVADVTQGTEEAGNIQDPGFGGQGAHIVDLFIHPNASRGIVDMDDNDIVAGQFAQIGQVAVGRVEMPDIEQQPNIVRTHRRAEGQHAVHCVEEVVLAANAQGLGANKF